MPSNVKLLAGASGGEPTDANFKNVTLLLHGDGSNGAQNNTFIDSSTNNFTITRNGNTTQGSFSPYGSNWSNYFDGSGDYISAPSNAALDCGTGDFTIECWVYISTRTNSYPLIFGNNRGSWTTDALALTNSNADSGGIYADRFVFGWNNGGFSSVSYGTSQLLVANATNSNNTWYHFAVVRNGTSIKMYRNGVEVASATISSGASFNWGYNGALVGGGNWDGAASYFNGYISNLRLLKGTALYTAAFTPSTTPLTAITNTSLLTCAYNRFRDGSTNNFTITRNGDVKVTNFAPFAPSSAYSTSANSGSVYGDGSGDGLTVATNTAFAFGTGDFTIEFWGYYPGWAGDAQLVGAHTAFVGFDFLIQQFGSGAFRYLDSSLTLSSGYVPPTGSWHHYAVTRSGTTLRIFVDGDLKASGTSTANISSTFNIGILCDTGGSASQVGYMSDVRIVKGTAVYTASFTPPTSPLTAISGTSLLVKGQNAAIFDNSMKNDLETVGNAQISTSVKKFGTGSMYFDGSGDYLYLGSNQDLGVGTGDFTIEAWIYPTGGTGNRHVFSGGQTNALAVNLNSSGKIAVAKSAVVEIAASTTTISTSTWTHIAITRSGNTFRVFVNGTLETTATSSQDFTNFTDNRIGFENAASYYVGYIDELRITKGVARYTASFTAPTAPFPNK